MRLTRIHVSAPPQAGGACTVRGEAANHLARVLRLEVGDTLEVFDGEGGEYSGRIEAMRKGEVQVALGPRCEGCTESPLQLTLAQGISRGERMDWVVQKAVELGVTRIVPVLTERSVVRLDAEQARSKQRHWHGVAVAACEQSGRSRLPHIDLPQPLSMFFAALPAGAGALRVLANPQAQTGLAALPPSAADVLVLIGPEGGLAAAESHAALEHGFLSVRLGPRVLRTETAAVAVLALLQQRFGDL